MSLVYKYIQKEPESQRNLSEWPGLHHYSSQYWFAYMFWSSSRRHWYKVEGEGGTRIIPLKDHITRRINSWILMQSPSFNPILRGRGDDDERRSCEDLLCIATVKWFHARHALLPIRLSQMPSMLHSKLFFFVLLQAIFITARRWPGPYGQQTMKQLLPGFIIALASFQGKQLFFCC